MDKSPLRIEIRLADRTCSVYSDGGAGGRPDRDCRLITKEVFPGKILDFPHFWDLLVAEAGPEKIVLVERIPQAGGGFSDGKTYTLTPGATLDLSYSTEGREDHDGCTMTATEHVCLISWPKE